MKRKAYPKYKPSGVEWLGDVPEYWKIKRLRYIFIIKKNIAGTEGYDVLSITQQGIKIKDIESNDGQLASDYSKYQLVDIGDFAMNHMDLLTGYVDIALYQGVTSPDYRVFSLQNGSLYNPKYYLYLLQLCYQYKLFYHLGQGVSGFGRWRLPREQFNNFLFPFPSLQEQEAITAFLDRETSRIDSLLSKKQRLLELLKEKRTALISRVVTKGLDPSVKLKPSGVEWLGDVPEHWEVKALKFLFENLDYKRIPIAGEDRAIIEKVYPYYGASGIIDYVDDYIFNETLILVAEDGANLLSRSTHLAFRAEGKYWVNNHAHILRPKFNMITYWESLLQIFDYTPYVSGSAQPKLTSDNLGSILLPVPPLFEQQAIADFLDRETVKIDSLSAKVEIAIERLKEYRTALINAAVTGKIDVREAL